VIYVLDPRSRAVHARSHCEVEGFCFLLTITSIQTGKRDRAAIVRCAYELQHYLNFAEDVLIEGVQMLCPPRVNGRQFWSLEDIIQIVCFRGAEADESAVVYKTASGTYKLGALDLRRKKTRHVWYSEDRLHAQAPQVSNRVLNESELFLYANVP
jgi:hypothetical protein